MVASQCGHKEIISMLVSAGAKVDLQFCKVSSDHLYRIKSGVFM